MSQYSRTTTENYTISSDTDLKGKAKELEDDIHGYAIRDPRYRLVEWTKGFKTYQPFDENKVIGYQLIIRKIRKSVTMSPMIRLMQEL